MTINFEDYGIKKGTPIIAFEVERFNDNFELMCPVSGFEIFAKEKTNDRKYIIYCKRINIYELLS